MEAAKQVKIEGKANDLIERIANDEMFGLNIEELEKVLKPENYIGMCENQVEDFINEVVKPVISSYSTEELDIEIKV